MCKNSPNVKIIAFDVTVAKNYLIKDELKSLERIVTMYLYYAELQAVEEKNYDNGRFEREIRCIFAI